MTTPGANPPASPPEPEPKTSETADVAPKPRPLPGGVLLVAVILIVLLGGGFWFNKNQTGVNHYDAEPSTVLISFTTVDGEPGFGTVSVDNPYNESAVVTSNSNGQALVFVPPSRRHFSEKTKDPLKQIEVRSNDQWTTLVRRADPSNDTEGTGPQLLRVPDSGADTLVVKSDKDMVVHLVENEENEQLSYGSNEAPIGVDDFRAVLINGDGKWSAEFTTEWFTTKHAADVIGCDDFVAATPQTATCRMKDAPQGSQRVIISAPDLNSAESSPWERVGLAPRRGRQSTLRTANTQGMAASFEDTISGALSQALLDEDYIRWQSTLQKPQ